MVVNSGIPTHVVAAETIAFALCEYDGEPGLTWGEVQDCQREFADYIDKTDDFNTTDVAFIQSDLNKDGVLLFEEWLLSMKPQVP